MYNYRQPKSPYCRKEGLLRRIWANNLHFYPCQAPGNKAKFFSSSTGQINYPSYFGVDPVVGFYYHRAPVTQIGNPDPGSKWQNITGTSHFFLVEYLPAGGLSSAEFIGIKTGCSVNDPFNFLRFSDHWIWPVL